MGHAQSALIAIMSGNDRNFSFRRLIFVDQMGFERQGPGHGAILYGLIEPIDRDRVVRASSPKITPPLRIARIRIGAWVNQHVPRSHLKQDRQRIGMAMRIVWGHAQRPMVENRLL